MVSFCSSRAMEVLLAERMLRVHYIEALLSGEGGLLGNAMGDLKALSSHLRSRHLSSTTLNLVLTDPIF